MGFMSDYLTWNEGNECPKNYHIWTAFTLVASAVSRRIYLPRGQFILTPNIYVCLVGKMGDRKTTAKDIGYGLLRESCPRIPVSAESMSKEAITQFMSADEQMRVYVNEKGIKTEYRPFSIFCTELKNFLSINPTTLVDFLITIYDRQFYDVITKNKGTDVIVNPCVNFLACETPDWLMARLRDSVISGGFTRRVIFVYETKPQERIFDPFVTPEGHEAKVRLVEHLRRLDKLAGVVTWSKDGHAFCEEWYENLKVPEDPVMQGYYRSKCDQLLKTSILVMACDYENYSKLILEREHCINALSLLDNVEKNMPKLLAGVGRNELAHPAVRIMDILESKSGEMFEADLHSAIFNALPRDMDFGPLMEHLIRSGKVVRADKMCNGVKRRVILTRQLYDVIEQMKQNKEKKHDPTKE